MYKKPKKEDRFLKPEMIKERSFSGINNIKKIKMYFEQLCIHKLKKIHSTKIHLRRKVYYE